MNGRQSVRGPGEASNVAPKRLIFVHLALVFLCVSLSSGDQSSAPIRRLRSLDSSEISSRQSAAAASEERTKSAPVIKLPSERATTTTTTTTSATAITAASSRPSTSQRPPPEREKSKRKMKQQAAARHLEDSSSRKSSSECDYEKGAWAECQSDGIQERTLKLTKGGPRCAAVRIMRRECRPGCKYVRGQWATSCTGGLRVRVDKLVASDSRQQSPNGTCEPRRRVTKDCKRACHYVKSAWSECVDGFKTRNLTLDETPVSDTNEKLAASAQDANRAQHLWSPTGAGCAKAKQVRRECGRQNQRAKGASGPANQAARRPPQGQRRLKQIQHQRQRDRQASLAGQQHPDKPASRPALRRR